MTDQEARDEAVHWVGDAPTSLHGNGASSFKRTTRDPAEVTCKLCLSQFRLDSPRPRDERDALQRLIYTFETTDLGDNLAITTRDSYALVDAILTAGYRKHPEPEWEYDYRTRLRRRTYRPGLWEPVE